MKCQRCEMVGHDHLTIYIGGKWVDLCKQCYVRVCAIVESWVENKLDATIKLVKESEDRG